MGNNSLKVRPPITALADWSKRLKPTIRPELETWPFFTHIEIGNESLADDLW
jgi:hypothetical protein